MSGEVQRLLAERDRLKARVAELEQGYAVEQHGTEEAFRQRDEARARVAELEAENERLRDWQESDGEAKALRAEVAQLRAQLAAAQDEAVRLQRALQIQKQATVGAQVLVQTTQAEVVRLTMEADLTEAARHIEALLEVAVCDDDDFYRYGHQLDAARAWLKSRGGRR